MASNNISLPFRDFGPIADRATQVEDRSQILTGNYVNTNLLAGNTLPVSRRVNNLVLTGSSANINGENGLSGNITANEASDINTPVFRRGPVDLNIQLNNSRYTGNGSNSSDRYIVSLNPNVEQRTNNPYNAAIIEYSSGYDTINLTPESRDGLFVYTNRNLTEGANPSSRFFNVAGQNNTVILDQTLGQDGRVDLFQNRYSRSTDIYNIDPGANNTIFISDATGDNISSGNQDAFNSPVFRDQLNLLGTGWVRRDPQQLTAEMQDPATGQPASGIGAQLRQTGRFTLFENEQSGSRVYVQHTLRGPNNEDTNLANFDVQLNADPTTVVRDFERVSIPQRSANEAQFGQPSQYVPLDGEAALTGSYNDSTIIAQDSFTNTAPKQLDVTLRNSNLRFNGNQSTQGTITATSSYIQDTSTSGASNQVINLTDSVYVDSFDNSNADDNYTVNFSAQAGSTNRNLASFLPNSGNDTYQVSGSDGMFVYQSNNTVASGTNRFAIGGSRNTTIIQDALGQGLGSQKTSTYDIAEGNNNLTIINDPSAQVGEQDTLNLQGEGWVQEGVRSVAGQEVDSQGRIVPSETINTSGTYTVFSNTNSGSKVYVKHRLTPEADTNLANFNINLNAPVTPPPPTNNFPPSSPPSSGSIPDPVAAPPVASPPSSGSTLDPVAAPPASGSTLDPVAAPPSSGSTPDTVAAPPSSGSTPDPVATPPSAGGTPDPVAVPPSAGGTPDPVEAPPTNRPAPEPVAE